MKSLTASQHRGRPFSKAQGASDAFDEVERFRMANSMTMNALAIHFGITPSSVARCLSDRNEARWTPTLTQLYRNVLISKAESAVSPALQRLASYTGPAEPVLKRLLGNMEELIETLSRERPKKPD
jgi:hypothetical protein